MNPLGRALQVFRPEMHRLAVMVFCLLGAVGAGLLKPWPIVIIVDTVLGEAAAPLWLRTLVDPAQRGAMLGVLGIGVLLLHLGQAGLATAQHHLSFQIGLNSLRRVRDEVFACLQRLSARNVQGARSGDLVHRTTWDTQAFQTLLQHGIVATAGAALTLVFLVITLWRLSVVLTLVVLLVMPLLAGVMRYFSPRLTERGASAQQAEQQVAGFLQQSIAALPLTQAFGREEHEAAAFNSRTAAAAEKRLTQYGWELGYWLVVAVVFAVATAGIAWLGAQQVAAGRLTTGQWLVFLLYLPLVHEPVRHLTAVGETFTNALAGVQRVFDVLDTPEAVRDPARPRPMPSGLGISFEQVSAAGPRDAAGLQTVSFSVAAGRVLAVAGGGAHGKGAVLNLIARRLDPASGVVRIDGVDVRELKLRDLRARIAVVQQDPIVLPVSIAENIAYGRPRAGRKEIEAAARMARADGFIRALPNGYMTIVGEGGTRLSPTERQRIELARAFLRDAPILLLDEPPAGPEPGDPAEAEVDAGLEELMRGRTVVAIVRRLPTLRRADDVLVLDEGRPAESGSPAELEARGGLGARMLKGESLLDRE